MNYEPITNNPEKVILVDEEDNILGLEDKMAAHRGQGILHRAVSVLVYRMKDGKLEFLIQKRSSSKLLWPGIWANTICTHPREGESYEFCAVRRLNEEMGIRVSLVEVKKVYKFIYQAAYDSRFSEHELDTVFLCSWDGQPDINNNEIEDYLWITFDKLMYDMDENPQKYSPWFHMIVKDERFLKFSIINDLTNSSN